MRGLFRTVENEDSESKSASRAAPSGRLGCLVMVMAICCVSAASLGRGFSSHSIATKRCRGLLSWRPMSSVLHLQPGASSRSLASRIRRSLSVAAPSPPRAHHLPDPPRIAQTLAVRAHAPIHSKVRPHTGTNVEVGGACAYEEVRFHELRPARGIKFQSVLTRRRRRRKDPRPQWSIEEQEQPWRERCGAQGCIASSLT